MPRILVVDDSLTFLVDSERLILKGVPHAEVLTAGGGEEALETLEAESVDLILTDLHMPGMNGLELVEALKENHAHIPVVLMTGSGSEAIAVCALESGAASYVPKGDLTYCLVPTLMKVLAAAVVCSRRRRLMSSQVRDASTFVIENDPALVEPLVNLVQEQIVRMQAADDRDVTRLGVAIHEALLNAIYHGNLEVSSDLRQEDESIFHMVVDQRRAQEPYRSRRVYVTVDISPDEARFTIRDEGPGFDAKKALDPNRELDFERVGGRGLLLIRSFLDVVYHNVLGNEIHLIKFGDRHRRQAVQKVELQTQSV